MTSRWKRPPKVRSSPPIGSASVVAFGFAAVLNTTVPRRSLVIEHALEGNKTRERAAFQLQSLVDQFPGSCQPTRCKQPFGCRNSFGKCIMWCHMSHVDLGSWMISLQLHIAFEWCIVAACFATSSPSKGFTGELKSGLLRRQSLQKRVKTPPKRRLPCAFPLAA